MPQAEGNLSNRKVVCRVVLFGTYTLTSVIAILLLFSFSVGYSPHALDRLVVCVVALLYLAVAHVFLHKNHHHAVACMLLLFYMLLATGMVWSWGINTPLGILIYGLVVVLAGILLTARHAFGAVLVTGLLLSGVQLSIMARWHMPDTSWTSAESSFGDIFAYCIVFGMLALVSGLYNREVERSLAKAAQAETALLGQKAILELQVEKRTAQLRQAQLEEMQQMYRIAELGQVGVMMLHDLANYMTALTLEIDDLKGKQHSKTIKRAKRITKYLAAIVASTRDRLHGTPQQKDFNVIQKISEVVAFLRLKAEKTNTQIEWQPPARTWKCSGDSDGLGQVIGILVNNAIDACSSQHTPTPRRVVVTLQRDALHTTIRIADWGKNLTQDERKELFKPFRSTKKSGIGIGLCIARQTVELQFKGTLGIDLLSDHTEFIIKLPRAHG